MRTLLAFAFALATVPAAAEAQVRVRPWYWGTGYYGAPGYGYGYPGWGGAVSAAGDAMRGLLGWLGAGIVTGHFLRQTRPVQ